MSKEIELTKEEIIRRIEVNNPGKFDFSLLNDWEYTTSDKSQKITLICKKHNKPFEIKLGTATRNSFKCPDCRKEDFFEESCKEAIPIIEKYFPNKYEVISKNIEDKTITFKCKDCGEIISLTYRNIRASVLKTSLCKKCRIPWTEEKVLKRWYSKWSGRYEVLNLEFIGLTWMSSNIIIKCNLCGKIYTGRVKDFLLYYSPCRCDKTEPLNSEDFIKRSKVIWGENTF